MMTFLQTNYTVVDTLGSLRAVAGFATVLFCPGYGVAWAADLFGFRRRGALERIAWGITLSFGVVAIFTSLAGRLVGVGGVAALLWVGVVATAALVWVDRRRWRIVWDRSTVRVAWCVLFGVVVVIASLVDVQWGHGLQMSVTVFDQSYRVAFTDAIARTGIPPLNPFFHPGESAPLRYYYFWYALCAVCMKVAHVSARQALIASSVWAGLGLAATIALFVRHFLQVREGLTRRVLVAVMLLAVTGLDILPVLFTLIFNHEFSGDLEWWSADQISSWMDCILWVPNHLASVICCLTAFLLLWRTQETRWTRRQRVVATVIAGVAAASSFGLSVYVAIGFAMLMVCWTARLLMRDGNRAQALRNGGAAGLTILLLIPYVREMLAAHSGTSQGTATGPAHLLQFGVRRMVGPELITMIPFLQGALHAYPDLVKCLAELVLLPLGYGIELGFYGVVLVLVFRARKGLDETRKTALFLTICGLVIVTFIRSAVIGNNDFGYRAAMLPSFFLLLLGADVISGRDWEPTWSKHKGLLRRFILLGAAGTAFQALELRFYVPMHAASHMKGYDGLPEAALAMRRNYDAVAPVLPVDAIVQANPTNPADYFFFVSMLNSRFQMVTDDEVDCGSVFGGDVGRCGAARGAMMGLFRHPAPSAEEAARVCASVGAQYLAVSAEDPAWQDAGSWVWKLPLVVPPGGKSDLVAGFRIVKCEVGL